LWPRLITPGVRAGRVDAGYLESNDCRKCHEGNYATWHATFHRTMTQEATPLSVLGDFACDDTITYEGVRADFCRACAPMELATAAYFEIQGRVFAHLFTGLRAVADA